MVGASQRNSRGDPGWIRWVLIWLGCLLAWPSVMACCVETLSAAEIESGLMEQDFYQYDFLRPGYLGTFEQVQSTGYDSGQIFKNISVNYLAMVTGPSFQGGALGQREYFNLRNFLGAGYRLGETLTFSGNANWSVRGTDQFLTQFHDPFFRLADSSVFSADGWNLYWDGRLHLPFSKSSMVSGMNLGVQSVQALTYSIPESRLAVGLSSSIRYNFLNPMGVGSDLELYLGPNVFYQLAPSLGLNLLTEVQWSHLYQQGFSDWTHPNFDLEPGLAWDLFPNLSFNPFVHLPVGSKTSLIPSYVGFLLSWTLL